MDTFAQYLATLSPDWSPDWDAHSGITLLMRACADGQADVVAALLRTGTDLHACDDKGKHAVHYACSYNRPACLRALLAAGASTAAAEGHTITPLCHALFMRHHACVRALLEARADPDSRDGPLTVAVSENDVVSVNMLLCAGANVDHLPKVAPTALVCACRNGHPELVHLLLDRGALVNGLGERGEQPLRVALVAQRADVALVLVAHGCDIDFQDDTIDTPLMTAIWLHSEELVVAMIERGVDVNQMAPWSDTTPLMKAALEGRTAILRLLLARPEIAIHTVSPDNLTAIKAALLGGHADCVRLLVEHGADLNEDAAGDPPIVKLAEMGSTFDSIAVATLRLFIELGGDVTKRDDEGRAAFDVAHAINPDWEGLELLRPEVARPIRTTYLMNRWRDAVRLRRYAFHWIGDVAKTLHAQGGRKRRIDYDHYVRDYAGTSA